MQMPLRRVACLLLTHCVLRLNLLKQQVKCLTQQPFARCIRTHKLRKAFTVASRMER